MPNNFRAYIIDLDSEGAHGGTIDPDENKLGDRLYLQYNPGELHREVGFIWASTPVAGHSHPRVQAVAGGEKTWAISVAFHLDSADKDWVKNRMLWLESLLYFEYAQEGAVKSGPHRLHFCWPGIVTTRCVLRPFKYTYGLFDQVTGQPRTAKADLVFVEIPDQAVDWRAVRG